MKFLLQASYSIELYIPTQIVKFLTSGKPPIVIARGGFSGTFPDSSSAAYYFALTASTTDTTLWCDVHLSKDGVAICVPSIQLDNCTTISYVYPKRNKKYDVNGVSTTGWFAIDFNSSELSQVGCKR
jgi:glycerophosphoryl diester phosphodiesterase